MTNTTTDESTPPRRALREAAPFAGPTRGRRRHKVLALSFVVMVLLPILASGFYLYTRAADQYASTLGFTVRSEDGTSASDLLGGLSASLGGGGSASDANILYEFIRSQEIVRKVGATLDLEQMYTRHADTDPLLSYSTNGTIEDLTDYWQRMVRISYDNTTGLTELTVLAFDPADARQIAEAIYAESSRMINALSDVVRDDATRYAQQDLDLAVERLKTAREALTAFRLANQIVDPNADIQTQMGLLSTLQTQQANALIEFEQLRETASSTDPRLDQARRKLAVIEQLIAAERQKFGKGGGGEDGVEYARTISDFERLTVEREYAETTYAAALAALDGARAAASRQSLYLAAYITPTLAEKSEYPQRGLILGLIVLFSLLIWSIACLIYYALRDRR